MTAVAALFASIPSPPWNAISIGPLNLRFYGLMIALGVIAAVWLLGKQLEQHRLGTTDDAGSIAVWAVIAGLIGARLYHVITDWSRFSDDLGSIPKVWEGGLGIPGGLIAGIVVGTWQATRRGIRPGVVMTFAAPAIALAQSIGRWGNWFNQELFGRATDLPWALEIDDEHLPAGFPSGTTFHPTFLYESLWNLALCVVLLRIQRQFRLGPGRLLAVYAIGYGTGRFWIEGLRIDPASEVAGLRWNQWMALAAIAVGVVALVITRGRKWDVPIGDRGPLAVAADGAASAESAFIASAVGGDRYDDRDEPREPDNHDDRDGEVDSDSESESESETDADIATDDVTADSGAGDSGSSDSGGGDGGSGD